MMKREYHFRLKYQMIDMYGECSWCNFSENCLSCMSRLSFRYILLLLVLFAIPGVVMIVAYGLISRELYRGIQFEMGHKKDSTGEAKHPMWEGCRKQPPK